MTFKYNTGTWGGGREFIKAGCAAALHLSRLDRVIGKTRGMHTEPLVLGYHRVVVDFESAARHSIEPNLISVDTLQRQIEYLSQEYEFVALDELVTLMREDKHTERRLATITFDDGYADIYENAFPLLRSLNLPFTVFVVSDLVGTDKLLPHDAIYLLISEAISTDNRPALSYVRFLPENTFVGGLSAERLEETISASTDAFTATRSILEALNLEGITLLIHMLESEITVPEANKRAFKILSWEMLLEMIDNGVTVGSHTMSHTVLENESPQLARQEINRSKRDLQNNLNTDIRHFAYPDGSFNELTIQEVARAGYISAVTTCTHQDREQPQLTIPRRLLWEKSSMNGFSSLSTAVLACQANGIFDPAAKCSRNHFA